MSGGFVCQKSGEMSYQLKDVLFIDLTPRLTGCI